MAFETITTDYVALSLEEHTRVILHIYRTRLRRMMVVSVIGVAALVWGAIYAKEAIFFLGLVAVFLWPADYLYIKGYVKRQLEHPKNEVHRDPTRAIISEELLSLESRAGVKSEVPWSSFNKIEKFGDCYLLYFNQLTPVILVPRAQSAGDWQRFSAFVDGKVAQLET